MMEVIRIKKVYDTITCTKELKSNCTYILF